MKVVVEYLKYPYSTYTARLINGESQGGALVQSIECSSRAEANEVIGTYNTFRDTEHPISLETALERVRSKTRPTWEEVFLASVRNKYKRLISHD